MKFNTLVATLLFSIVGCSTTPTKHPDKPESTPAITEHLPLVVKKQKKENIRVGRYMTLENTPHQTALLDEVITITIPTRFRTIKDGIDYMLTNTGYQLAKPVALSVKAQKLLKKKLPLRDRRIGPITVRMALQQIIGPAYCLKEDQVNRLVGLDVK